MNKSFSNNVAETSAEIPYALRSVHELTANPRNARTHGKSQIDKLAKAIKAFGFINPVIIDGKGKILAGHGRLQAALQLGLDEVPCVMADHLTEAQQRAYMLADNRIPQDAGYDEDILRIELKELASLDFDMDLTGFDGSEIADFTHDHVENTPENDIPDAPAVPVTALGDIWVMGKHRLRCGDSCDPEGVKALLAGAKPHLMVTDPPYGVEYDANFRNGIKRADGSIVSARAVGKVMNDDRADWTEAWELSPCDVAYVWCASMFNDVVIQSLEQAGFMRRCQIIWAKNVFAIGRGDYHWQHEPCWYAVKKGATGHWNGSRKETSIWNIDKPQKSETGHSTQKPVECMRRPMMNNSKPGDIVYDPFLGSGTTLIAAETEARVCYGSELNPVYCDIIVKRWQNMTGKKAVHENGDKVIE